MFHRCFKFLTVSPTERLQALYDCLAPFYFLVHPFVKAIAARAVALLDDSHGLRALDICTGTGIVAEALSGRGCRVTGIDLSAQMLSPPLALRRAKAIANVQMDARQLSIALCLCRVPP